MWRYWVFVGALGKWRRSIAPDQMNLADFAGFSRLVGLDEEGTLGRLKTLRRDLIDPTIAEHRGRIVKTTGDGILIEFASVVDAVRCAAAVQQATAAQEASLPQEPRIE